MEMVIKFTKFQMIMLLTYIMNYKQFIILCEYYFIHPAPSVDVSFALKDTIKSLKNITTIVLEY